MTGDLAILVVGVAMSAVHVVRRRRPRSALRRHAEALAALGRAAQRAQQT